MGMSIDKTIEFFNGLECCTPQAKDARDVAIETMQKYQNIKALGEELRIVRKGIADEKVLIGYNLAVAICNKHLGESEE